MATETAPRFTPPTPSTAKNACHFHKHEHAITKCARCGTPLCADCSESYKLYGCGFDDKPLCYNCCKELVKEDVRLLRSNRRKIVFNFILTLVGMIFGFIVGFSLMQTKDAQSISGGNKTLIIIASVFIGGCLWTFIRSWLRRMFADSEYPFVKFLVGLTIGLLIEAVLSVYRTVKKIVLHIIYLVRTSKFIKSEAAALASITDYFNYTVAMDQNSGSDLTSLAQSNSYARTVLENGEIAAVQNVRQCVTSISESGEIIRSFQD